MIIHQYYTPLGLLLLEMENDKFTKIWFTNHNNKNNKLADCYHPLPDLYALELQQYFRGKAVSFDWPIKLYGSDFQKQVWQEIRRIPYGTTTTYKQIAENLSTKGYQAVGSAVGSNPLAIIIPCHRVIGSADLGGYHYGLMIKRFLLEIENALPQTDLC